MLGRARALVCGHLLCVLQSAAIRNISGDSRRAEGMVADRRTDANRRGTAPDHAPGNRTSIGRQVSHPRVHATCGIGIDRRLSSRVALGAVAPGRFMGMKPDASRWRTDRSAVIRASCRRHGAPAYALRTAGRNAEIAAALAIIRHYVDTQEGVPLALTLSDVVDPMAVVDADRGQTVIPARPDLAAD
jgi:hypothetical protein